MYNWNKVFLGYCDGASFSGDVREPVTYSNTSQLHFKGSYILEAVYSILLDNFNMSSASDVVVSGSSAGGLSVYLHLDHIAEKITSSAASIGNAPRVVGVPDAGIFMDLPSITGTYLYTPNYKNIFAMQNVSSSMNSGCIAHYSPLNESWKCFMTQYTLQFVKTPMFIVQSFVDSWEGSHIMGITCDPRVEGSCDESTIEYMDNFRISTLNAIDDYISRPGSGAWLCECWTHLLVNQQHYWQYVPVEDSSLGKAFLSWYLGLGQTEDWVRIDGPWGSNPC